MIGRGLKNELTGTWMNYSIPIGAVAEVTQPDGKVVKTSMVDIYLQKEKYVKANPDAVKNKPGRSFDRTLREMTGIALVADPVDVTPPYVEDVDPGSPAAQAGMRADDLIVYVGGVVREDDRELQGNDGALRQRRRCSWRCARRYAPTTMEPTLAKPTEKK